MFKNIIVQDLFQFHFLAMADFDTVGPNLTYTTTFFVSMHFLENIWNN